VLTTLFFLGPRAGIVIWWLLEPVRWQRTFDTFLWPLLGFLFLPWTTLAYVVVAPGGVVGLDWILLTLGLVIDLASYTGGGYGNRGRARRYAG
jgi:hypothetical protein